MEILSKPPMKAPSAQIRANTLKKINPTAISGLGSLIKSNATG